MNNLDWDENEGPLAYLITFRTYATWLHGDDRFSVDAHGQNLHGAARIAPNKNLANMMSEKQASAAFVLNREQRGVVEQAIRNVCERRGYGMMAIHVRTNHAHNVVAARCRPEIILNAFKANATRELREAGLIGPSEKVWSRGGSTRYLWKPGHLEGAVNYVLYGQGDDLPKF